MHRNCLALLPAVGLLLLAGCQNQRSSVLPPPGGGWSGDPYYNRPAASATSTTPPIGNGIPVNLSPTGLPNLPPPPTASSSYSTPAPRDTYDVATRVAADGQPIRVIDSNGNAAGTLAGVPRGMPLNDGMLARSWQSGAGLPSSLAGNPFSQLRGTADARSSSPQGFSGQDGQWRSRSSYESTERR